MRHHHRAALKELLAVMAVYAGVIVIVAVIVRQLSR
jgi:hypothetical protein